MNLAETQRLFWSALRRETEGDAVELCFTGSTELPAAERVEIYANMYVWRLVDALRADFPKVAALLGDEDFFQAMAAYIDQDPSESPDIGDMGRRLPEFLRKNDGGRPGLGDLAALEWARARVFLDAPATAIPATVLASVPPDRVPSVRLRFIAALRLLDFERTPLRLWQAIEAGETPGEPADHPGHAVVWRNGFEVFHLSLTDAEAEALRRAIAGDTLERVCEAFVEHEEGAAAAFAGMAVWFQEGWVTAVEEP